MSKRAQHRNVGPVHIATVAATTMGFIMAVWIIRNAARQMGCLSLQLGQALDDPHFIGIVTNVS